MSFGALAKRGIPSKALVGRVTTAPWKRSPSWVALPSVISTDEKFVGLYAVWPDSNYVALTAAGNYNIDFGDGSASQNIATGVQVNYQILYSAASLVGTECPVTFTTATSLVTRNSHGYVNGDKVQFWNIVTTTGINQAQIYYVINSTTNTFQFSTVVNGAVSTFTNDGTGSLLPYRQAIITVTPQAGQTLTALNLNIKNTATGLTIGYSTGWLDIALSMPNCSASGLVISASVQNVIHGYLQQASIVNAGGLTTATYMFYTCFVLQSIVQFNNTLVTDMSYMFYNSRNLQTVPLFNTAAVTLMNNMFGNCAALQTVPLFNTAAVTTMANMFVNCTTLQTVPLFNTAAVTTMASMFNYCNSLQTLPAFNCTAVTPTANLTGLTGTHPSLSASNLTNVKLTHTYAGDKLSASAINTIFTNLPTVTGQTITILGNPGGGTCTTSIATAKGWTVA